ncbi:hydroxyacid dehydrogenase [Aquifex aeolicus]|uniref:D-lactate dehydrogenase n=1 Tax=Aquifex aeolicus (strain VF5) TaxID=224324 RepID=O66939_AQUAE|nr:hydroxyacid dehydrogenase [Aquifex aeolicus]AAC06898.1 D-lactate dehydrogenase [Aquifex aeolicus VF5]
MNVLFTSVPQEDVPFYQEALKDLSLKIYTTDVSKVPENELKKAELISVFVYDKLTEELLSKMPRLKLIHTRSVGFDHIDLDYCKKKGILVTHIPAYSPESVAEHTFAMILTLVKRLKRIEDRVKKLNFSQDSEILARELNRLTLGVIGTGRIGSRVAMYGLAFGMKVLCYDVVKREDLKEKGCVYTSLDELLKESDVISLHVPYTKETHHMINEERISLMKDGVYLINTARGKVVDTDALYRAYQRGKFSGLGLDVFEDEEILILKKYTEGKATDKNLKILELACKDNVIITPHIAYYTDKSLERIREETVKVVKAFVKGDLEQIKGNFVVGPS